MTTYSGLENSPADFVPSGQLGGDSDEPVSFIYTESLGGDSDEAVDFIPTNSLGGASDEPISFVPTNSLGGSSDEAVDFIPTNSLGGASDEPVPAYTPVELLEPPRTQVLGRSYTQPQRDVVYRVQPAALAGVDLLSAGSYSLYVAVAPYSIPIEAVILVCTAGSGVTADAAASLETSSGVVLTGPTTLSQFRQAGDVFALRPIGALARFLASGEGLRIVINSGAAGSVLIADAHVMASLV